MQYFIIETYVVEESRVERSFVSARSKSEAIRLFFEQVSAIEGGTHKLRSVAAHERPGPRRTMLQSLSDRGAEVAAAAMRPFTTGAKTAGGRIAGWASAARRAFGRKDAAQQPSRRSVIRSL